MCIYFGLNLQLLDDFLLWQIVQIFHPVLGVIFFLLNLKIPFSQSCVFIHLIYFSKYGFNFNGNPILHDFFFFCFRYSLRNLCPIQHYRYFSDICFRILYFVILGPRVRSIINYEDFCLFTYDRRSGSVLLLKTPDFI